MRVGDLYLGILYGGPEKVQYACKNICFKGKPYNGSDPFVHTSTVEE